MYIPSIRCLAAAFVISLVAFASPPANAQVVDLTAGGQSKGFILGVPGGQARFDFMTQQPTGTGVIKPFLRVQNTPSEQGYNTSGVTPQAPYDDKAGIWTHDLLFTDLLQTAVTIDGVTYFKLLLDVNEPNGKKSRISLDNLQFYTSSIPSQTGPTIAGTLVWSFKPFVSPGTPPPTTTHDRVLMDAALNHGSGSGDMYAFIPAAAFAATAAAEPYVYLYCFFGQADITTAGGFEEWALVLNTAPPPTPTPTPTPIPRPNVCDAVGAEADSCYPFFPTTCFSGQAVWLPGLVEGTFGFPCDPATFGPAAGTDGFKFVFSPPGTFTENANGTASLTGHVESQLQPGSGFDVNVQFAGFTTTPCPGNPLMELLPSCYVPPTGNGPVDPSTWHYYAQVLTATLTGTGNFAGGVVSLMPTMGCYQVGDGASGKNVLSGSSGWFKYTVVSQPTNTAIRFQGSAANGQTADFNLNCGNLRPGPTPTPTPKKGKGP